ncbi:MAG: TolC family protein [Bacteroidales bacterium]|nr:TolC family protein [Bacteroidales bacterium]
MKKMKRNWDVLLMFCLMLASSVSVLAQNEARFLSLQEAVSMALKGNSQIAVSDLDEQIASSDYRKMDALFLPKVNASYTAMQTNNPLNVFGAKLQQQSVTAADFNPSLLNEPSAQNDFGARIDMQMPLLNVDQLYTRKALAAQKEAAQYGAVRTKEYITFEMKKAYLQLQLAYQQKVLLEEALQTANAIYNSTERFYEQGLIRKSDLLNAKVHVSSVETELEKAKSNISNASDYVSLLMGSSSGVNYTVEHLTLTLADDKPLSTERVDFLAMQQAVKASDMMAKSASLSLLPRLNAFGSYQWNDSKAVDFHSDSYLVGIQLSWSLFNGTQTKHTIRSHKLMSSKLKEQLGGQLSQAQLEWNKTKRDLENLSFELRQQADIVQQATEALRIIQNRYEQGLEKTSDLLVAQTQLSQQQMSSAATVFKQNLTVAYLEFITSSNTSN